MGKQSKQGPKFVRYFGPVVAALKDLGGSARPAEVRTWIADDLELSDELLSETLDSGTPRYDNQVAWARFYLARAGLIDSSKKGVWRLTEVGRKATIESHEEALKLFRRTHEVFKKARKAKAKDQVEEDESAPEDAPLPETNDYKSEVMAVLRNLSANGFERFCQRLLRESGFEQVRVTGRANDGGIDGDGILQVNALVSFKVMFQCKRYKGTVGSSVIRDFRGAMMGRSDKGIILTTGTFSAQAKKEAIRDGVPPIELVDYGKLIDMMEDLELGLNPRKTYDVDTEFFEEFRT